MAAMLLLQLYLHSQLTATNQTNIYPSSHPTAQQCLQSKIVAIREMLVVSKSAGHKIHGRSAARALHTITTSCTAIHP
jgi:hypothetical protein